MRFRPWFCGLRRAGLGALACAALACTQRQAPDAGATATLDAGSCAVKATSYEPAQRQMSIASQACTTEQVLAFRTNCLVTETATGTACSKWRSDNLGCSQCVFSEKSARVWGPLVEFQVPAPVVFPNRGGCIEVATADRACAQLQTTELLCTVTTCAAACPVDATSGNEAVGRTAHERFNACLADVAKTICKAESDAARACEERFAPAVADTCRLAAGNLNSLTVLAAQMCAAGPIDVIPDAGVSDAYPE